MTVFDLLFIFLVLASLVTWIAAAMAALSGRRARALGALRNWGAGTLVYLAAVAVVGLFSRQRIIRPGEPWCFDDWCLAVDRVTRAPSPPRVACTVSLRIFSRARRVSQRAKGAWIYVVDRQGHRYAPEPDPSAVPLDVLLRPGESVTTARTFKVPPDAGELRLITGHGFPCCYPSLIIADDSSLLHKRTYIRLP